jgi:3-deoxy-D-manno-octulosonic-acid transferase
MIYYLYRIFMVLLSPILYLWVRFRVLLKKENPNRVHERFGYSRLSRPPGPVFWFHGASNGECLSFLSLLKNLQGKYPTVHFLVTSGTLTSAKLLEKLLPTRAFHQFLPIDNPIFVKRFLNHWNPTTVFWTESDLWPHLIFETSKRNIPLVLLNGRLSQKSLTRWKLLPGFIKNLLSQFKIIFSASPKHQENFEKLGLKNTVHSGNLKFSGRPLNVNQSHLKELNSQIKDRPVWVAACTHPGEEEIIVSVHKELSQHLPDILTLVVPRHPHRAKSLEILWKKNKIKYGHRSFNDKITKETEFYIFDTTGELGLVYSLTNIAFVGGSLVPDIGGHNPIEGAQLKNCIITGPHISGNASIFDLFSDQEACFIVHSHRELSKTLLQLFTNNELRKKYVDNAEKLTLNQRNVLEIIVKKLEQNGVINAENTEFLVQER